MTGWVFQTNSFTNNKLKGWEHVERFVLMTSKTKQDIEGYWTKSLAENRSRKCRTECPAWTSSQESGGGGAL